MDIKDLRVVSPFKLSERANKEVQKFIKDMEDGIASGEIVLKSGVAKDLEKLKVMMKESEAAHGRIVDLGKVDKSQRAKVVFYYRELFTLIGKILLVQLGVKTAAVATFLTINELIYLPDKQLVFLMIAFLGLIIEIVVGVRMANKFSAKLSSTQYDVAVKEQVKKVKVLMKKAHSITKKALR